MNMKIELADPQLCDGCPCLRQDNIYTGCNLDYICEDFRHKHSSEGPIRVESWPLCSVWPEMFKARPRECIEKHGL